MGELIVDFAHRRRSNIESKDVKEAVKFSPVAEVRFYESSDEPDVSERYFTEDDYKAFRKANLKAVVKVHQSYLSLLGPKSQEESDEDLDCSILTTGLENLLTPTIIKQTAQRKKEVRQAVLDEQKHQQEHGYHDRFMIAHASRCHSALGVKRAQRIAGAF